MSEILFATTNLHKVERFQAYYEPLGLNVLSMRDVGLENLKIVEDGNTPEENAVKKALTCFRESGMASFGVDYGLYIDKFPDEKQPGLFVRRIYGDDHREVSDEQMLQYYIRELKKVGGESTGKWVSSIALALGEEEVHTENFSRETLFVAEQGPGMTPGEPLNSIQKDPVSGKYFTELSKEDWLRLAGERERGYVDFMAEFLDRLS